MLAGADQAAEEVADVPVQPAEDTAATARVAAAATDPTAATEPPLSDAWSWASASPRIRAATSERSRAVASSVGRCRSRQSDW